MGTTHDKPNRVLVFNSFKKLVGIYHSTYATAKSFHTRLQSIKYACDGTTISCQGHYFRVLNETLGVTLDSLGALTLQEYDRLCGVERKVYRTGKMERKGMKYNKQPKE